MPCATACARLTTSRIDRAVSSEFRPSFFRTYTSRHRQRNAAGGFALAKCFKKIARTISTALASVESSLSKLTASSARASANRLTRSIATQLPSVPIADIGRQANQMVRWTVAFTSAQGLRRVDPPTPACTSRVAVLAVHDRGSVALGTSVVAARLQVVDEPSITPKSRSGK